MTARTDIDPIPHVYDDRILDLIGREFRGNHPKGLAEWLKNSADAYLRAGVEDEDQVILIDLIERSPKKNSTFRVVDFVGMTSADITDAFMRWGDPTAARRGGKKATLGGHGNGGKLYMRTSFGESRFITYRDGRLNAFGFDSKGRYGYLKGFEDKAVSLEEALDAADLDVEALPEPAKERLAESQGFTVVVGERAENFSHSVVSKHLIDKLLEHPQARRLITHKTVIARFGKKATLWSQLMPLAPTSREGFPDEEEHEVPASITDDSGQEHVFIDADYTEAYLVLRTSRDSLRARGHNNIEVLGEANVIASYDMSELGAPLRRPAQAEFIYGDLVCPKLEDPEGTCVTNDRERLVANAKTAVLLAWVRERVNDLADRIAEDEATQRRDLDLNKSSVFNELLNQWKNQFVPTLFADVFGGSTEGADFGGGGAGSGGNSGDTPTPSGGGDGTRDGRNGGDGGSGDERKRAPRTPVVLLSSYDADPLDELEGEFHCDARHPAVYQRREDVEHGYYWINTSRPLAERILNDYGAESTRWRDYMFQRYVEIILKESIRELEKRGGEMTADALETHINQLYLRIQDEAEKDLSDFLFKEKMTA